MDCGGEYTTDFTDYTDFYFAEVRGDYGGEYTTDFTDLYFAEVRGDYGGEYTTDFTDYTDFHCTEGLREGIHHGLHGFLFHGGEGCDCGGNIPRISQITRIFISRR